MRSVASLASELSLWMLTVVSLYLRLVKVAEAASSLCIMTPMTMASSHCLRLVTMLSLYIYLVYLTTPRLYLYTVVPATCLVTKCTTTPSPSLRLATAPSPSLRLGTVVSLTSIPSHLVSAARQMCPLP